MGAWSLPEKGRLAQGGSVSVSVVGSGHRENQLWSQALREDVGSTCQRGLSQQPPDPHTLWPPRRGCGGRPWAHPAHSGPWAWSLLTFSAQ